jgi:pSer/pThr/pTyr-binding forkhead associated (FHA) protein
VIPLPAGKTELLLGRTDPVREIFPDVDLADYGGDKHGVSRSHARLSQSGHQLLLEDLNSTNFTFLNQRKLEPGQRYPLNDGDEIRLALLVMEYRTG